MKTFADYPLNELKLIYSSLWTQALTDKSLVSTSFLQDLQDYLLAQATRAGVDVSEVIAWSQWLNEGISA